VAVAGFSPDVLVDLVGSIVGSAKADPPRMSGSADAATQVPPPPVVFETFLAAIAIVV